MARNNSAISEATNLIDSPQMKETPWEDGFQNDVILVHSKSGITTSKINVLLSFWDDQGHK